MNVSHETGPLTEEAAVRLLRAARANDAAALPARHAARTPECVPVSRAFAFAKLGARLTAVEQRHLDGCPFCQRVFRSFHGGGAPVTGEETTVFSAAEETTHIEEPKPPPAAP